MTREDTPAGGETSSGRRAVMVQHIEVYSTRMQTRLPGTSYTLLVVTGQDFIRSQLGGVAISSVAGVGSALPVAVCFVGRMIGLLN